jgi:methyl-accepting chemotaxis protein
MRLHLGQDPVIAELNERLKSLDSKCLTHLEEGLAAIAAGDLTLVVEPSTTPITTRAKSGAVQELVDDFNSMLSRAQAALESYEVAGSSCGAVSATSRACRLSSSGSPASMTTAWRTSPAATMP